MTSVPLHALSFLLKQPPRPMHRTSQHALPAVLEQIPNTPPPMDVISLWPTFLIPFLSLLTIFNSIKSNTSLWLICPFPFPLFFFTPRSLTRFLYSYAGITGVCDSPLPNHCVNCKIFWPLLWSTGKTTIRRIKWQRWQLLQYIK